jgi:hypothetical protein
MELGKGQMPVAEVVRLIDLVNYQDGSVVSRTLVKGAAGTSIRLLSTRWLICWRARRRLRFPARCCARARGMRC